MRLAPFRLVLAVVLTLSLAGPARLSRAAPAAPGAVRQLIVQYQDQAGRVGAAGLQSLSAAAGLPLSYVRPMLTGAHVLALPRPVTAAEAERLAARLAGQPGVALAVPDYVRQPLFTPNDPLYPSQWHLSEAAAGINAPAAWEVTTGITAVVVAILDTGVLTDHPDLPAGRLLPGYDFVAETARANDGDGRDSDPRDPGDWVTAQESGALNGPFQDCPVTNSTWHGTHVAGLVAAEGHNSLGVAGVAWGTRLLPVRVLGKCGGLDSDIADAMLWAAGLPVITSTVTPANPHPARVLNLSLGEGGGSCGASVYPGVISALTAAGVVVVAAAGNTPGPVYTPADCAGVIAVSAHNRSGDLANFSSSGPEVTLSAPGGQTADPGNGLLGESILSLHNSGVTAPASAAYAGFAGTSAAAPQAAGAAALLLALNPDLTLNQIEQTLTSTARPFSAGSVCALNGGCGAGRLDVGAAVSVTLAALPAITVLSPAAAPVGSPDQVVTITGRNFAPGAQVLWGGVALSATVVSATQLTTTVPAGQLAAAGQTAVRVQNPAPAGTSFYPATFTVGAWVYLPTVYRAP